MPFIQDELSVKAKGGTELTKFALQTELEKAGRLDLFDFFDIYPSRVRNFNPDRPSIYWAHDLAGDPEAEHLREDKGARFKSLVFVSDWQYSQFMNAYELSGENSIVIYNGFYPAQTLADKWTNPNLGSADNPIRLIYHTTPHRGLQILVPVFEHLYQKWLKKGVHLHLDVYSSFSIYGWGERDGIYKDLFAQIDQHPGMTYHGAVGQPEVREALDSSHIFAYPSIWAETFCLAAVEAISARNLVVHSNYGALPETTGNLCFSYPIQSTLQLNAERFLATLEGTINLILVNKESMAELTTLSKMRVDGLYSWASIAPQWINTLDFLKSTVA